jgi:hypothetical protein
MTRVVYIIEHPTRGTFREMDSDWRAGKRIDIPRFSRTGSRNDAEKAMQFRTLDQAQTMLDRIWHKGSPSDMKCRVRRTPEYEALCPECGEWANRWFEHADTCSVHLDELKAHGVEPFRAA